MNEDMQTFMRLLDDTLAQKRREGALTSEQANGIYVSTYNRVCAHLDDVAAQAQAGGTDAPTPATPATPATPTTLTGVEPATVTASSAALVG